MLGQYFSCNSDFIGKDEWIPNMDGMLHKDIPWGKMNNRFKTVNNLETYRLFADDMDIDTTKTLMKEMNETGQKDFINKRAKEYNNYKKQEAADLQRQNEFDTYMKKHSNTERKIDYGDEFGPKIGGGGIGF